MEPAELREGANGMSIPIAQENARAASAGCQRRPVPKALGAQMPAWGLAGVGTWWYEYASVIVPAEEAWCRLPAMQEDLEGVSGGCFR
jgi:hypothetical protein